MDVAIVGAGIMGCAAARELAAAGLKVVVIEPERPGAGASRAAAGILSPQADVESAGPLLDFGIAARQEYPRLVDELASETGIDVGYRATGTLTIALDSADEARIERCYAWQHAAGLPVERVPAGRIHALEPAVNRAVREALLFPYDHHVDNVLLVEALAASAERRGVQFLLGRRAVAIEAAAGQVRAVRLDGGLIEVDRVILAAGSWSGQIEGIPEKLPVFPVRGQMIVLDAPSAHIEHVVIRAHGYLVPRRDGRVLAGSTIESVGFDARVTAGGVGGIITEAIEIAPALERAPIRETWAGLRPGTPDGLPIIGLSALEGLVLATGHYRSGILLGPLTGKLAAELVISGSCSFPIDAFDPARFSGTEEPMRSAVR